MGRLNNLVLAYKIVEAYTVQYPDRQKNPLRPWVLKDYIKQKTAVRDETATEYMRTLENGITIEGKLYKLIVKDGGYSCQTQK